MRSRTVVIFVAAAALLCSASGCFSTQPKEVGIRIGDTTLHQFEAGKTTEEWLIAILGEPTTRAPVEGLPNVEILRYTTVETPSGFSSLLPGQRGREVATTYFVLLNGVVEKFWQDRRTESGLFARGDTTGSKVEPEGE